MVIAVLSSVNTPVTVRLTSVICVLTTSSASLHYVNSNNITISGKRSLKLCRVISIHVPGLTEFMNSTSKIRLYFNTRQTRKKYFKYNLEDFIYVGYPVIIYSF